LLKAGLLPLSLLVGAEAGAVTVVLLPSVDIVAVDPGTLNDSLIGCTLILYTWILCKTTTQYYYPVFWEEFWALANSNGIVETSKIRARASFGFSSFFLF